MNPIDFIFRPSKKIEDELTVSRMEALRKAASRAQPPDTVIGGKISTGENGWRLEIPSVSTGGAKEVSRLQITKKPPLFYDSAEPVAANEFFISAGLYNGFIPSNISNKFAVNVAADTEFFFWVEVDISATNPAFSTAVVINSGTVMPTIPAIAENVFPSKIYVRLGYVRKTTSGESDTWTIVNEGNGNIGGGISPSRYTTSSDGNLLVYYGFSFSRHS
jgi:hypothetical protein